MIKLDLWGMVSLLEKEVMGYKEAKEILNEVRDSNILILEEEVLEDIQEYYPEVTLEDEPNLIFIGVDSDLKEWYTNTVLTNGEA